MRYLKKFENVEEASFREITSREYFNYKWLKFENSEINQLKKIFSKNGLEISIVGLTFSFKFMKKNYSNYLKKIEDNYYLIKFFNTNGNIYHYYICDDIYGVSKFLDYIKNIYN